MATIQIVLDDELLRAADQAVERTEMNRSALFRTALRHYLKAIELQELERRDRDGYLRHPDRDDRERWEGAAQWPPE